MYVYFLKFKGYLLNCDQCKDAWFIPSLMHPGLRHLCVMFCFSRKAASCLKGDVPNCHFTVLDGKLVPTGLFYPDGVNPSPQTTPSYSCCTKPEPFQGRVARVLHLSAHPAQGCSTCISSAKDHTELQMKHRGAGKHVDNTRCKMGRCEAGGPHGHTCIWTSTIYYLQNFSTWEIVWPYIVSKENLPSKAIGSFSVNFIYMFWTKRGQKEKSMKDGDERAREKDIRRVSLRVKHLTFLY